MKKTKTLSNQFKQLIDSVGAETVRLLSDKRLPKINPQSVISTGNLAIDRASSIGGFPRDRIIEIYGNESSGKSTVAAQLAAQFNKEGKYVLYIDFEHAVDIGYFVKLGVRPSLFALSQPMVGEEGTKLALNLAATPECGLVVIDSVAAITTQQELDGELDDANIGATARLMGRFLRKMVPVCSVHNTLLVCINQNRDKIGGFGYGSGNVQPGGRALKFYSSMRIELARTQTNKDKGEATSNSTKAKFVKNKLGHPYKEAEFEIVFGKGADNEGAILEASVTEKIIVKKGRTYSLEGSIIGTSEESAKEVLREDEKLRNELIERIKAKDAEGVEEYVPKEEPKKVEVSDDEDGGAFVVNLRKPKLLDD
jgi:recombination protein RecA